MQTANHKCPCYNCSLSDSELDALIAQRTGLPQEEVANIQDAVAAFEKAVAKLEFGNEKVALVVRTMNELFPDH